MKDDHTFWHKNIKREENSKSSDFWTAKRNIWFQKNDDSRLGRRFGERKSETAQIHEFVTRMEKEEDRKTSRAEAKALSKRLLEVDMHNLKRNFSLIPEDK